MQSPASSLLRSFLLSFAALAAAITAGCGGGASSPGSAPFLPPPPAKQGKHFTHIVVLIQENRTFDNLFATFPGADGTTVGKTHNGTRRLAEANLESPISPNNGYEFWIRDYNHGLMNHFDLVPIGRNPGTYVYQYVNPAQIRPYWDLAHQYVLADHTFQTQGSGSFTAHQDLIRGGTDINSTQSLIDFPTKPPWGCDAPAGVVTTLITTGDHYLPNSGPFPCLKYETLRDTLDEKGLSWRYYAPAVGQSFAGNLWNAFDAIAAVRHGPEWSTNQISPETKVLTDISRDTLPAVSWVVPDFQNSDHPGGNSDSGPSWVAQVVNAIGESSGVEDYRHHRRVGRLGRLVRSRPAARAPALRRAWFSRADDRNRSLRQDRIRLAQSVRARQHRSLHRKQLELAELGNQRRNSADFTDDFFNFKEPARKFAPIGAKYSRSYFLRQKPSNRAVDDE